MAGAMRPLARTDVLVRLLGDEVLIFDPVNDHAVSLNRSAAVVWEFCDGSRTVERLVLDVSRHLGDPVTQEFIELSLEDLHAQGLLSGFDALAASTSAMTRREVLRRIGLTTVVAVPVIVGIATPAAAASQSGLPNGTVRPCSNIAPGCVQILLSPQIFRCPDSACASGFCAIQTPNREGNCAA